MDRLHNARRSRCLPATITPAGLDLGVDQGTRRLAGKGGSTSARIILRSDHSRIVEQDEAAGKCVRIRGARLSSKSCQEVAYPFSVIISHHAPRMSRIRIFGSGVNEWASSKTGHCTAFRENLEDGVYAIDWRHVPTCERLAHVVAPILAPPAKITRD